MDENQFLKDFEDCVLPFDQWTHRAHIMVAYLYVSSHSFQEALSRTCAGIRKYNAANKVPETPVTGYNQTTTVAFVHLVAATAAAYKKTHRVSTAEEFCDMHPQLMSKHVLRFFYSPQRRMDPSAKTTFIEPDLTALPKIIDVM
jgi:hypothetical protein